jgi:hypothetical protein
MFGKFFRLELATETLFQTANAQTAVAPSHTGSLPHRVTHDVDLALVAEVQRDAVTAAKAAPISFSGQSSKVTVQK